MFTLGKGKKRLAPLALTMGIAACGLALLGLSASSMARAALSPTGATTLQGCSTLVDGDITVPTTWTLENSPYCVQSAAQVAAGIPLLIEPGVVVSFTSATSGLNVIGSLTAIGTPAHPITLTSGQANPLPGDWGHLHVAPASSVRLEYCDVSAAGYGDSGAIQVENDMTLAYPQLVIRNSRLHHNQGKAIYFYAHNCVGCYSNPQGWSANIEDTRIEYNTGEALVEEPGVYPYQYQAPLYHDLELNGNGLDALVLLGRHSLHVDRTLDGPGSFRGKPIQIRDGDYHVQPGVTLRIAPGTTLQFGGFSPSLTNQGRLLAEGTLTQPITFTSASPSPQIGDWRGISLPGYLADETSLANCDISYAVHAIDTDNSSVTIQRCRIHHNRIGFDTFYASPILLENSIYDNLEYGIQSDYQTLYVDARHTWWGHASGPYHPSLNPAGLGNRVSDHVRIIPWNMVPESLPPTFQPLSPSSGTTLSDLPLQFSMRAENPDEGESLFFRVEIFSGYARVRDYNQSLDPAGWDRAAYTSWTSEGITATLTLPEALPNGNYTWVASVSDGWHTVGSSAQPFQVDLSNWGVAGVSPAEPLAVPNVGQPLSVHGLGFTPEVQVWLEQARFDGTITRLDPTRIEVVSGASIDLEVDFTGRSGPWDVVIVLEGEIRRTRLYLMPYLALTSLDYQNSQDIVMNHITPHYLHLANHGSAPGVAVVGVKVPTDTLVLDGLLDPARVEYLGEIITDTHLFAIPLAAQEDRDETIYFQVPQAAVNLPGDPIDPNKHDWTDPLRFRFWVLGQPVIEGWQVLRNEAENLEQLVNGAIWGSALIEGWAIDQYAELADEALAGEYIERLGARYPIVADALVMRQLQEFQLLASLMLGVGDVPAAPIDLALSPSGANLPVQTRNGEFGKWVRRQIGDPWSFTKGFLLQVDENGFPWSQSQMEYERGTFLVAESEGLVEGLTFGLYKPPLGYWNYYHINGEERGLIEIGQPMGNFLSIPLGMKLPGEISKGGISLVRRAADGLRPGGDRYWSIFKLTVEGNAQEPARLGLSVLWKGGDDLASLWKGRDYNLIHWGDNPSFGGSHWGIGWMSEPVIINDVVQTGRYGEVLYKSGAHIYTNHAFIPYRWKGAPFGQVDLSLLRGEINLMHQVPAAAWRAGLLEESLLYPAEFSDETACGDGSQRLMTSWDPNDIEALPNRTHIWPTQPLEFLIRFENLVSATLPAETVTVSLQLDEDLDWNSIQLLDTSHPEVLSLGADTTARKLVWRFNDIQLPPNANPPEGQGWARLRIRPNPTLTTGDQITTQASIVFDQNEPLLTNVITYTIDLDPPLPDIALEDASGEWPLVRLTATDNPGGSGVSSVAFYYSRDNTHWTAGAALSSDTSGGAFSGTVAFIAEGGHYWLRAAAADFTGNISPMSEGSVEITLPHRIFLPVLQGAP